MLTSLGQTYEVYIRVQPEALHGVMQPVREGGPSSHELAFKEQTST
jgi:hypothetical protein